MDLLDPKINERREYSVLEAIMLQNFLEHWATCIGILIEAEMSELNNVPMEYISQLEKAYDDMREINEFVHSDFQVDFSLDSTDEDEGEYETLDEWLYPEELGTMNYYEHILMLRIQLGFMLFETTAGIEIAARLS